MTRSTLILEEELTSTVESHFPLPLESLGFVWSLDTREISYLFVFKQMCAFSQNDGSGI